jgi:CheY-like chemotaxis protein
MRKPRAIICDDDGQILNLLQRRLEMLGYEILTAETPMTCAFYREHVDGCPQHDRCTDVLVTDYDMPDMTGLELLEIQHRGGCKLTSRNKALMTGNKDSELKQRAEALGCHFFPKPLLIPTLIAWLKECETRFDLSEPLASDLYQPAKKKSYCPNTQPDNE